jgi:hypothetical protein
MGIILRVLRLEVSVYNVYITDQFQTTFTRGGGGGVNPLEEVAVYCKEENLEDFCPKYVQEFGLRFLYAKAPLFFFKSGNTHGIVPKTRILFADVLWV